MRNFFSMYNLTVCYSTQCNLCDLLSLTSSLIIIIIWWMEQQLCREDGGYFPLSILGGLKNLQVVFGRPSMVQFFMYPVVL